MKQVSSKTARKVRRRLENEVYAKDAYAWGKVKTIWSASGTIYRPIDRPAFQAEKRDPEKSQHKTKRKVSVYLFRIKTKGHDEEFLKIGISNNIQKRFEPDLVKYKFHLLGIVDGLTRREALDVECRLHDMFSRFSHRPRFGFVTGGYTECYVDCADVVDTTLRLFALIKAERGDENPNMTGKIGDPFAERYLAHHERLMKTEKNKMATLAADASVLIEASVAARRARQRKQSASAKNRKSPSIDLLKNQSL